MEADCFRYGVVAKIALQKLDPFDFDGVAVFAQGDCSWEVFKEELDCLSE